MLNGARLRGLGTEKSKGTKVFALAGKVKRGGLVEVPMGITIREIIFDVGGGIPTTGSSRPCRWAVPRAAASRRELLIVDTPVDYDEPQPPTGAIMGSGGMVVMDETTCMVDVARFFL
jgi:NADH-quinone oxidoreductase subunit F